ncbi:uncharacterized protein IL334_004949 [Kwoniella shivajii]|uniref:Sister chromatid cohesion protein DCC1 n=1 Tax=Kwoniella shivajii TaxID=564305 RepID=A0ABZ1D1S9_9TREE|nr:hypothetical protein IL334_004949 [Kwoniella shivajii]
MPVGSNLPHKSVILRYPPSRSFEGLEEPEESYQLLELPPEILKAVEAKLKGKEREDEIAFPLTIKGKPSDDAVLCTPDSTFLLRTVGISNSLLICRTPSADAQTTTPPSATLQVRDTCHEILECVPVAPNLERIRTILKDSAWQGLNSSTLGKRKRDSKKIKKWTRDQLNSVIQGSEEELAIGLKERNVIEIDGKMLLLPPVELKELLSITLSLLVIHNVHPSTPHIAPSAPIISSLDEDHEVPSPISNEILKLFGEVVEEDDEMRWKADIKRIVREVGNGLLIGAQAKKLDAFEEEWKNEVGEGYVDHIDLKLLEGEYLLSPPAITSLSFISPSPLISHFPISQLPLQPATRFADLFLTRPKWKPEEIIPFLKGLTRDGDIKSRDKLVQKFVRVVKEKEGVWWYPRRTN